MPWSTMSDTVSPALEDLQWLSAFARHMARNAHDADDLVQETLVTAWTKPPAEDTSLRPWLATVLRNRFRMQRRTEARRGAREAAHAPEATGADAPDQAVARIQVLTQLTAELEQLSVDDQRLIVRRFFEGQSAADIGRALSIPAGTIRSRLSRVLTRLRDRLDERCEGRDVWCAAILAVPMPGPEVPVATEATSGGSNMVVNTSLIAVLVGGTAAAAVFFGTRGEAEDGSQAPDIESQVRAPVAEARVTKEEGTPASDSGKSASQRRAEERKRWEQKKAALDKVLDGAELAEGPKKTDTRMEYSKLILRCVRDIEDGPAKFSVKITEVGAPDIGTIVTHAEVVDASVKLAETVECAEQSMYAFIGPAPEEPYEKTFRFGMMAPKSKSGKTGGDGGLSTLIHHEMERHYKQVRACEPQGIEGFVELEVVVAADGTTRKTKVIDSSVSKSVSGCIRVAAKEWRYPHLLEGTHRHRFELPIKDHEVPR